MSEPDPPNPVTAVGDEPNVDASAPTEERVGYGRPPKQYRIKPGERRNPRGRPKGSRNAKTIIREEHQRTIRVQEDGRLRNRPAIDVLIRKDMNDALMGNEKAKARQISLALRIADEQEAKAALNAQRNTLAEDEHILARYLPQALATSSDEGQS